MKSDEVNEWFDARQDDYSAVEKRLDATRNVVLNGREDRAAAIVERAYSFAVFSIQTPLDRHEAAFTDYYSGGADLETAITSTVYGGNKYNWVQKTFKNTDWNTVVDVIRTHVKAGDYSGLLGYMDDELTGVSYRKGAFTLAMCGLTEYLCVDSNVANYAGLQESTGNSLSFTNADEYMAKCYDIIQSVEKHAEYDPFIIQWAIYDYERGEHARHGAYFREIGVYRRT